MITPFDILKEQSRTLLLNNLKKNSFAVELGLAEWVTHHEHPPLFFPQNLKFFMKGKGPISKASQVLVPTFQIWAVLAFVRSFLTQVTRSYPDPFGRFLP